MCYDAWFSKEGKKKKTERVECLGPCSLAGRVPQPGQYIYILKNYSFLVPSHTNQEIIFSSTNNSPKFEVKFSCTEQNKIKKQKNGRFVNSTTFKEDIRGIEKRTKGTCVLTCGDGFFS